MATPFRATRPSGRTSTVSPPGPTSAWWKGRSRPAPPPGGRGNDDVSASVWAPQGRQAIHEHVVALGERVLHGGSLDPERLRDEGLYAEEDDEREEEGLDDL